MCGFTLRTVIELSSKSEEMFPQNGQIQSKSPVDDI